jgi:hypothetical protein
MQGIFISYRRQDSQSAAGRLADHLKEQLPEVAIFRDVETIEPGVDFVEAIDRALRACGVLLAVIGPRWLTVTDEAGRRRLENSDDYTRLEVGAALRRHDVRVIPVLVEGAQMPTGEDLPEDLKPLARRNAIELTDKRWDYDVGRLADTLRSALGLGDAAPAAAAPARLTYEAPRPPTVRKPAMTPWRWAAVAAGVLVVIGGIVGNQPEPMLMPPVVTPMANLPVDTANLPETASIDQAAKAAPTALTGNWHDAEGGRYRFVQMDEQLTFDGASPHGEVYGSGSVSNNRVTLAYNLGGVNYIAELELSADARGLRGYWSNPATGERGILFMERSS